MKILKPLLFFTLTFLVFSATVSAQDSKEKKATVFKGKVMRSDTNKAVPKVKILLMDEKKSDEKDNSVQTETDADGKFLFDSIKPGKYTISIRAVFEKEEDVPCQLLMGKIDEPNSQLLILTEDGKKVEQIFIKGFSVKEGKEIVKEYDLVCKSLFGK
jgi:hypothetical protein